DRDRSHHGDRSHQGPALPGAGSRARPLGGLDLACSSDGVTGVEGARPPALRVRPLAARQGDDDDLAERAICTREEYGMRQVAAAASPIRQLTETEAANLRPTWSPDHSRIAFQSNRDGAYHIYVMDADGKNTKQVSSGDNVDDRHPTWSPDGKFIAVDSGDTS